MVIRTWQLVHGGRANAIRGIPPTHRGGIGCGGACNASSQSDGKDGEGVGGVGEEGEADE